MTRRNCIRQTGALLALLAVWIQLVMGFGHLHAEALFGPAGLISPAGHGAAFVALRHDPHPGAAQEPGGDMEHGCAICAGLAMLATGALPDPVALPAPVEADTRPPSARAGFLLAALRISAARSRAPPFFEPI